MHRPAHQAGMEVAHVKLGSGCSSESCHLDLFQLGLLESFRFRPSVLEPDFDLRFGEPKRRTELGPLGYAEVLLFPELLLEGQELLGGEGGSGLSVRFVLPEVALDAGRFIIWKEKREEGG